MANIKITVEGPLMDGHKITFKAPCNCSVVEKLDVRYIESSTQKSKLFTMKDSHGNDLTGLGNLFSEGAYVDVVLDANNGVAYLQNAGTNAYLEQKLKDLGEMATTNLRTLGFTKTKNLVKKAKASETIEGITFTTNSDGSITANGTATASATFIMEGGMRADKVPLPSWLKIGESYIISGNSPDMNTEKTRFFINIYTSDSKTLKYTNSTFTVPDNAIYYCVGVNIAEDQTVNDLTFYPMIRSADITDDTYEPYVDDVATRLTPVDNLESDRADLMLSARQGKKLFEMNGGCYLKYENGKFYIGVDDTEMGV